MVCDVLQIRQRIYLFWGRGVGVVGKAVATTLQGGVAVPGSNPNYFNINPNLIRRTIFNLLLMFGVFINTARLFIHKYYLTYLELTV